MKNRILVVEISGKRPGTKEQRPTEKFEINYDHLVISNNSEGYTCEWEIINVPDDYRQWYINNHKNSDNAWYAPMNRSYAIKYAKEHGYEYLVQMDDNITKLEIATLVGKKGECQKRVRILNKDGMINSFIEMFKTVLDNTNAVMVGCDMSGLSQPDKIFLAERYCYSFFMLDLKRCPEIFQGDFEDDIEYRLKCSQIGAPVVQVCPLRYSKTAQQKVKDLSGCRSEYLKAGIKRGDHMKKLYVVKLCESYKKDISENLNLKANQTFLNTKYKKQAGYFKEQELRAILQQFVNLDENYKNGTIDLNIGLESIICGYCS